MTMHDQPMDKLSLLILRVDNVQQVVLLLVRDLILIGY